jgi:hypothetical protein
MRVDDVVAIDRADIARHVIGCHVTKETRVRNACRRRGKQYPPGPTSRTAAATPNGPYAAAAPPTPLLLESEEVELAAAPPKRTCTSVPSTSRAGTGTAGRVSQVLLATS